MSPAWSLRAEGVSSVLVGAETPRLLREQLHALQVRGGHPKTWVLWSGGGAPRALGPLFFGGGGNVIHTPGSLFWGGGGTHTPESLYFGGDTHIPGSLGWGGGHPKPGSSFGGGGHPDPWDPFLGVEGHPDPWDPPKLHTPPPPQVLPQLGPSALQELETLLGEVAPP